MAQQITPGRYWHRMTDGRLQCDLCPRFCRLQEDQRGLCFVRARRNDQIVLTTYGRSSGFSIDPVEKKPLHHFLPGTPVLSFGTAGCNLACKFCQNWDISKSRDFDRLQIEASPCAIANSALTHSAPSVAFTYNDPVIFLEYAVDTAIACHQLGIKTVAVTAGYMTDEPRIEFFKHMDAANIDLKAFSEQFYYKLCGGHLQPVLETICYLKNETPLWFELTYLLIPGENDSENEIERMTQWVAERLGPDVPVHFTAFHPAWKMTGTPSTPSATLARSRAIALKNGIRYAYTGNIHDFTGSSTWCADCGGLLIGRDWYELSAWNIGFEQTQAVCQNCSTAVAGVFDYRPGTWGRRCQQVRPGN